MEQPANTYLAAEVLTLSDGVPRTFHWNYGAMIAMADAVAIARKQDLPANGLRTLRDMLWAGCKRDADKRGEEWTTEKVEDLIPVEQKDREQLEMVVMRLIGQATRKGESKPAVAGAKREPAGVSGGRKRKS